MADAIERCNRICQYNDHIEGCMKPDYVTCTANFAVDGHKTKVHILGSQ